MTRGQSKADKRCCAIKALFLPQNDAHDNGDAVIIDHNHDDDDDDDAVIIDGVSRSCEGMIQQI